MFKEDVLEEKYVLDNFQGDCSIKGDYNTEGVDCIRLDCGFILGGVDYISLDKCKTGDTVLLGNLDCEIVPLIHIGEFMSNLGPTLVLYSIRKGCAMFVNIHTYGRVVPGRSINISTLQDIYVVETCVYIGKGKIIKDEEVDEDGQRV